MNKKLLGIKVAEKLVESNNENKVSSMIIEERLLPEAARYILDNFRNCYHPFRVIRETINNGSDAYKFENLYKDFADYVNSGFAKFLYNHSESGEYLDYIGDLPKNSSELMSLYTSSSKEVQGIIYKTLMYRKRAMLIQPRLVENYVACFDAIVAITQENNPNCDSLQDLYAYVIKWASFIDKRNMAKVIDLLGIESFIHLIGERQSYRYSHNQTPACALEMVQTYSFLQEQRIEPNYGTIVQQLNFTDWDYRLRQQDDMWTAAQNLYNTFIGSNIGNGLESLNSDFVSKISQSVSFLISYENNDDKKNTLFELGIKTNGFEKLIQWLKVAEGYKPTNLTPYCVKLAKLLARDFDELVLDKRIETADDLIRVKKLYFPHRGYIGGFYNNPFAYSNIKLEMFSDEDMNKLNNYINWRDLRTYFSNGVVPINFLLKHGHKTVEGEIAKSVLNGKYKVQEVIQVLETFKDKLDESNARRIVIDTLEHYRDGATEEDMVKLLNYIPEDKVINVCYLSDKYNLSLEKILTLL